MRVTSHKEISTRSLAVDADGVLSLAALCVAVLAILIAQAAGFGAGYVAFSVGCFVAIALLVLRALKDHPFARFGLANLITTVRAGLTSLTGALIFEVDGLTTPFVGPSATSPADASQMASGFSPADLIPAAIVAAMLALDGLDGFAARRLGLASRFGARYDMEIDALLILFLSGLVFALGKVGAFVLVGGLLRYGFVALQWAMPPLSGPLGPSFRRKAVCVLQGATLCLILTPFVTRPVADALAGGALLALLVSFGVDIARLRANHGGGVMPGGQAGGRR